MARRVVISLLVAGMVLIFVPSASGAPECFGLPAPVPGQVVAGYAPTGRYSGHWGIDFDVPTGTVVRAVSSGVVSFAGTVAGNRTITIDHGGGLLTSYSFLDERWAHRGVNIASGQALGTSGLAHDAGGLHFSVRIGGAYVNPLPLLACRPVALSTGLHLIPDDR